MGWRSGFLRKLYGNLQSFAYTVSGKNVAQGAGTVVVIKVMEVFTGVTEQEASNQ